MSKKLIAACMVIAASAVIPSLASAKPVITHPTGTVFAAENKLLGTNVGDMVLVAPGGGEIRCSTAQITGTLTVNSTAGGFEADIESATIAGSGAIQPNEPDKECTGYLTPAFTVTGLPWCLEGTEANDTFKLRGGGCTKAAAPMTFTFSYTIFGFASACKYSRAAASPVAGTFTTHDTGDALATVTGEPAILRTESAESCPSEFKLKMSLTLETDNGGTVEPLYISA
jgi:hypothetical protein